MLRRAQWRYGHAGTTPGLVLSARPLAFGRVSTGAGGKYLGLTFSNSSNRPERLEGFRLPAAPYGVSGLPRAGTVLAPRAAVTLSAHFDPQRAGAYPSRLAILANRASVVIPATGGRRDRTGEAARRRQQPRLRLGRGGQIEERDVLRQGRRQRAADDHARDRPGGRVHRRGAAGGGDHDPQRACSPR